MPLSLQWQSGLCRQSREKRNLLRRRRRCLIKSYSHFFVAQLLTISFIKLVGGIVILWIAVKLFIEGSPEENIEKKAATITQAVKIIVIADISMSIDNMLAVGGASHGNMFLLLFRARLEHSVCCLYKQSLSMLMDKYPVIIYIGAAVLGKVGGEMIITDPFTVNILKPGKLVIYSVEALFAVGVIAVRKTLDEVADIKNGKRGTRS